MRLPLQTAVLATILTPPTDDSDQELNQQKQELSDLILSVLRRHPFLCYFQGYHDICQVFLLVLPPPLRSPSVARLSALRIRDFMLPNLSAAVAQLRLIFHFVTRACARCRPQYVAACLDNTFTLACAGLAWPLHFNQDTALEAKLKYKTSIR